MSKENLQLWLPLIQPGDWSPCTGENFSTCLLGGDSLGGITTHAVWLIRAAWKDSQEAVATLCLLRCRLALPWGVLGQGEHVCVLGGSVQLQPLPEPLGMTLYFFPFLPGLLMGVTWMHEGENTASFCLPVAFPSYEISSTFWYSSFFMGMLLCLDSSFLALQVRNRMTLLE